MCFKKIRVSLFGREKAPAGALTPSTELLVFTTYYNFCLCYIKMLSLQQKKRYYVFSRNKNVSFWEKKAPAGAPSPSTVLLRGILFVYKTKSSY